MRKFAYYYEPLENIHHPTDDVPALIKLHEESFNHYGWEVFKVDERTARQHPKYETFDNPDTPLGWSKNQWSYTRACYMRWLAYSVADSFFADYDVINYGFSPADADNIITLCKRDHPIFLSTAGAVGLLNSGSCQKVIQTYLDFIDTPDIKGAMAQDVNDMTIMRQLHPEWYETIPYTDIRFCKDYTVGGWERSKLVHYPYFFTKSPRFEVARSARTISP